MHFSYKSVYECQLSERQQRQILALPLHGCVTLGEAYLNILCLHFIFKVQFGMPDFKNVSQTRTSLVVPWLRIICQYRRHEFDTWPRKIPHATEQLKPCTTTTEG